MVFRQGRLDTLSKGSHELKIQRDPLNRPNGITENGVTRLALSRDEKTGLISSLEMNRKKYLFDYEGKPRIENVGGQNLVGGVEPSLHQITYPQEMGGKKETYDFAVTEKMLPSLNITDAQVKERMIVWGTEGKILQDREWTYTIKPQSDPNARFASIERKNAEGKSEFWNKDEAKGEEVTQGIDGVKTVTTWFTSGIVAGKLRKEVTMLNNKILYQNSRSYDDNGRVIKIKKNNQQSNIIYNFIDKTSYEVKPYEEVYEKISLQQLSNNNISTSMRSKAAFDLAILYISQGRNQNEINSVVAKISSQDLREEIKKQMIISRN
jgi:hypothetical protein